MSDEGRVPGWNTSSCLVLQFPISVRHCIQHEATPIGSYHPVIMNSAVRQTRALRHIQYACQSLQVTRQARSHSIRHFSGPAAPPLIRPLRPSQVLSSPLVPRCASLHVSSRRPRRAHNNEDVPDSAPTTDFARMDMLGQTPAPSTSVDICMSEGFKLNSGASIYDGRGVMLVDGEAFAWQPWGPDMRLLNDKGQWEVREEAFALLGLLWPRPGKVYPARAILSEILPMANLCRLLLQTCWFWDWAARCGP